MTEEVTEAFDLCKFTPTGGTELTSDSMNWRTCALPAEFVTVSLLFFNLFRHILRHSSFELLPFEDRTGAII